MWLKSFSQAGGISALANIYQGYSEKRMYDISARSLETEGDYQKWRGEFIGKRIRKAGKSFQASQRAAMASQGIDPNTGSSLDVLASTASDIELDALIAEHEGKLSESRERTQATLYRMAGRRAFTQGLFTGLSKFDWRQMFPKKKVSISKSEIRRKSSKDGFTTNYPWYYD